MSLFRSLTILEVAVDVRFTYSRVQRECVCCLHFSKDMEKKIEIFLLQVLTSKIEETLQTE